MPRHLQHPTIGAGLQELRLRMAMPQDYRFRSLRHLLQNRGVSEKTQNL